MKLITAALFVLSLLASPMGAAQNFPTKPVRIVVPAAPGGGLDLIARNIAAKLTEIWGQQVLVENRPGANFVIGTEHVTKSDPDGYTLLLVSSGALTVNPVVYSNLPYDPQRDLTHITLASFNPFVLLVNNKLPVNNVGEFIAYLRANPKKLNHASNSATTILSSELLKSIANVDYVDINYKGGVLAAASTSSGETDFCFVDVGSATAPMQAGRVKALAVTSATRYKLRPNLPTLAESGLKGYSSAAWIVISAPAKTPANLVSKINADAKKALSDPQVVSKLEAIGNEVLASTPEEAVQTLREDLAKWSRLVKDRNIKLQ